jgi:hypothetical protein
LEEDDARKNWHGVRTGDTPNTSAILKPLSGSLGSSLALERRDALIPGHLADAKNNLQIQPCTNEPVGEQIQK